MSFILDALRKSETERQRQSGPGLGDAGYRPPARARGPWLPLLVLALVANLVLLAFFWWRAPAGAPAGGTSAPAPPPTVAREAPSPASVPVPARAPPDEAAWEAIADVPALDEEPVDATPAGGQPAGGQPPATLPLPDAVAESAGAAGSVTEDLPNAEQLIASGALTAPAMRIDMHVFSEQPAERFVFINMRKYTEGAQLTEGPLLEEITREGAVLSQGGQRFVLNRE